jgi:hypothetical protein
MSSLCKTTCVSLTVYTGLKGTEMKTVDVGKSYQTGK